MTTVSEEQGESLVEILNELGELVRTARAMPMSASVLINRAEVLELIDSARDVLPDEIAQAEQIREDAAGILTRAEEAATELVGKESVVREANERASEIIAQAEARARELAREADDYCDRKLAEFEIDLGRISDQVAAGRERLQERSMTND